MRLSHQEISNIRQASRTSLPSGSRVLLFGSRLDDSRRGGDIDLLVESPDQPTPQEIVRRRTAFAVQLMLRMDEQRFDILMPVGEKDAQNPVVVQARAMGVELT
jgi:uncharacterized protein